MVDVPYSLKMLDPEHYRVTFHIEVASKVFKRIYSLGRVAVKRKSGMVAPKSPEAVEHWSISSIEGASRSAFLKQVDLGAKGFFKTVVKETEPDGFILHNRVIRDCDFTRLLDGRIIMDVIYEGECSYYAKN